MADFAHKGMTLEEAKIELRRAKLALAKGRRYFYNGKSVAVWRLKKNIRILAGCCGQYRV